MGGADSVCQGSSERWAVCTKGLTEKSQRRGLQKERAFQKKQWLRGKGPNEAAKNTWWEQSGREEWTGEPLKKSARDVLRKTQAVENFKSHLNAIQRKQKISFKHVAKAHSQKWKLNCIELELSPFRSVEIRKFKDTVLEMVWERALAYTAERSGPSDLKGTLLRAQAHTSLLSVHFSMCMLYLNEVNNSVFSKINLGDIL